MTRTPPEKTGGDLKALAKVEQDAPFGSDVPRCLAHIALQSCTIAVHTDTHHKGHEASGNSILEAGP